MKDESEAKKLANQMIEIGKLADRETVCVLTDMDEPLGYAVGNTLEVIEAVQILKGEVIPDVEEVVLELGAYMLQLAGKGNDIDKNKEKLKENLQNGNAYRKFLELVKNQGGDITYLENLEKFEKANVIEPVYSEMTGYIYEIDAKKVGELACHLRAEPNTSSEIVANVTVNTSVDVYEEKDGWSKVKIKSLTKEGYISTALLSDTKQETSRGTEATRNKTQKSTTPVVNETTTTTTTSEGGTSVVAKAKQYIGSRYVYGGSSPSGFDCSGFTSYVYKQFGVSLNRTAAGQYSNGTAVSKSQLQPGDLVMFGKSGINHVGIYIGGGRMVHAANPSRGVTTDTINSGYYANNYVGARRVM